MAVHGLTHGALLASLLWIDFDAITWTKLQLQLVGCGLVGTWWVAFLSLFYFGERKYRRTFYDTATGPKFTRELFETGEDEAKARIFSKHIVNWEGFKGDIAAWLEAGWHGWEREQLAWFTSNWKNQVPDGMRPDLLLLLRLEEEGAPQAPTGATGDAANGRKSRKSAR